MLPAFHLGSRGVARVRRVLAIVCLLAGGASATALAQVLPFDEKGTSNRRESFSALPYEHIDPMTGNLLLTFTDLELPGNAGFNLRIQRTFNSKIFPFYHAGANQTLEERSWVGVGWRMHLGRVLEREIEMPDGSRHQLFNSLERPGSRVTRDYWLYNPATRVLEMPNGLVYTFGHAANMGMVLGTVYYVTEIRDPFNNRITVDYVTSPGPADGIAFIRQYLGSQMREVRFGYDPVTNTMSGMAFLDSVWTYQHVMSGTVPRLTRATPPIGTSWEYEYSNGSPAHELTRMTTPYGGIISFGYADSTRQVGASPYLSRVVTSRAVSGRELPAGTWTFEYGQGTAQDLSIVNAPCGRTVYRYLGVGTGPSLRAWQIGLLAERTVYQGAADLQTERFEWQASVPLSNDSIPGGPNGEWADTQVFVPLLTREEVRRDAQSWNTYREYATTNYNDYGRPFRMDEQGELRRITTRTFQYGFTPRLIDRLASEQRQVGTETATSSWTYTAATGFQTGETISGITTTFEATGEGNILAQTDAHGHRTSFTYAWGVRANTQTPLYLIERTINPEGTVASELRGGFTTRWEYDALFRLRLVRPVVGNLEYHRYDDVTNLWYRVERGNAQTEERFDGFGRLSRASTGAGVTRTIGYDACGRTTYSSYPFQTGVTERGVNRQFDALSRPTRITHADTTFRRMTYTGLDWVEYDENNQAISYNASTFGSPSSMRLMEVVDSKAQTTRYEYNLHGNLTRVTGPGTTPARSWTYDTRNLLTSETHPEAGTTTYTYDAAGRRQTMVDARAQTFTYGYDNNDRSTSVDGPGTAYDMSATYDARDLLLTSQNGFVADTLVYDGSGQLTSKSTTINGRAYQIGYAYNGNGVLTQLTYPSGRVLTYGLDNEGRQVSVTNNGTSFATSITYHPTGTIASYVTGSVTHAATIDTRMRPATVSSSGQFALTYGYDGANNVTNVYDTRPGKNQSYTYDSLNRLLTANGHWGAITYAYDAAGNRTSKAHTASTWYNYDPATRRLQSLSGAETESFTYDAAGNLTGDGRGTYTHTPGGLMETATGTSTATYRYDADNRRALRIVNGRARYTVRGAGGEILSEFDEVCPGTIAWSRDYVYGSANRLLGAVAADTTPATLTFTTATSNVAEAAGTAPLAVRLTTTGGAPLVCASTVSYASASGTALAQRDFTTTTGLLTFPAGSVNGATQTINVPIAADLTDEFDEQFTVTLSSPAGATLGAIGLQAVTIIDDDAPPTLVMNDASRTEGQIGRVDVVLSRASEKPIQVNYTTVPGTAAANDFVAASGQLTIPVSHTVGFVDVQTVDDTRVEKVEALSVQIASPVNATINDASATISILDNERPRAEIDPGLPGSYFADVGASASHKSYILLLNPHGVAVTARITYTRTDGSGVRQDQVVPAGTRMTLDVSTQPGIAGETALNAAVQSLTPSLPLVADVSSYWGAGWQGGRSSEGGTPAADWYFAEGSSSAFWTEALTVFNPTNDPVDVTVTLYPTAGSPVSQTQRIEEGPGYARVNVQNFGVPEHGIRVSGRTVAGAAAPIAVERSIYWANGDLREGHSTPGASATSMNWYFAEGGAGAWATYVPLTNPGATAANVTIYYLHENGTVYSTSTTVPAGTRTTVGTPGTVPSGGFGIHVAVTSGSAIVAERVMYGGTDWTIGLAGIGSGVARTNWRFAEGSSGTFFSTWILLANPSVTPAAVTLRFRTMAGVLVTQNVTVPARGRLAVSVDAIPGLSSTEFGTEVQVTNGVGIVAERVTYWPDGGWYGGHLTLGHP